MQSGKQQSPRERPSQLTQQGGHIQKQAGAQRQVRCSQISKNYSKATILELPTRVPKSKVGSWGKLTEKCTNQWTHERRYFCFTHTLLLNKQTPALDLDSHIPSISKRDWQRAWCWRGCMKFKNINITKNHLKCL